MVSPPKLQLSINRLLVNMRFLFAEQLCPCSHLGNRSSMVYRVVYRELQPRAAKMILKRWADYEDFAGLSWLALVRSGGLNFPHNPKVGGSNPPPATMNATAEKLWRSPFALAEWLFMPGRLRWQRPPAGVPLASHTDRRGIPCTCHNPGFPSVATYGLVFRDRIRSYQCLFS